jgi:hypothetical protein
MAEQIWAMRLFVLFKMNANDKLHSGYMRRSVMFVQLSELKNIWSAVIWSCAEK